MKCICKEYNTVLTIKLKGEDILTITQVNRFNLIYYCINQQKNRKFNLKYNKYNCNMVTITTRSHMITVGILVNWIFSS